MPFALNTKVRLKTAPDRSGRIISGPRVVAGRERYVVEFPDGAQELRGDHLDVLEESTPLHTLIEKGRFGGAKNLRFAITFTRLTGRLADVIYSMEASNTEFLPYQFKPVLNFLDSPSRGILIADEVGLGKTIEAGLVWTELRARYDVNRLLVLCPAVLREKWRDELAYRFGVRAEIVNAKDLLRVLDDERAGTRSGFAAIASFNALRPPSGWDDDEERASKRAALARRFRDNAVDDPLFDLVIIDEAHYLRNRETQTNALGRLIRQVSDNLVLLSATPLQLRSEDLFNLLQLVDEDSFRHIEDFRSIIEANAPLIKLASQLRRRELSRQEIQSVLDGCKRYPLLASSGRLELIESRLKRLSDLRSHGVRVELADQIERVNLLARVVSRTRKRDVQENRVERQVDAPVISMTPTERKYYENVTAIVRRYCAQRDLAEAFIQTIPQRQMCSSIPASFRAWTRQTADDSAAAADEESSDMMFEHYGVEIDPTSRSDGTSGRPLLRELTLTVSQLADYEALKSEDSKFRALLTTLKQYWSDYPDGKVIVFSYYRETVRYLAERLIEEGEDPVTLMGGIQETKQHVIDRFREAADQRVLIATEVASEGVDLQFASFLINYDLPWNPMRVEQRIGRIDRIGQKRDSIRVLNFFYSDTLDDRIYSRLFDRLDVFRSALGDIEIVLGEQLRDLSTYLLTHELTPEQETERIEQTKMALEANMKTQRELEEQANALVAHGDFVLSRVKAAKELRRYVDGTSLWIYVRDYLAKHFQGCKVVKTGEIPLSADIVLSQDARVELSAFLERHKDLPPTRLAQTYAGNPIRCVFSNQVSFASGGHEVINQHHPLVRFITARVKPDDEIYPISAIQLDVDPGAGVLPGQYLVLAHMWSTQGARTIEKLVTQGCRYPGGEPVEDDVLEPLLMRCVEQGRDWLAAETALDRRGLLALHDELTIRLEDRFMEYADRMRNENNADVDFQIDSLRRRVRREIESIQSVIVGLKARGQTRMIAANEGRISARERFLAGKTGELEAKRDISSSWRSVICAVVDVR